MIRLIIIITMAINNKRVPGRLDGKFVLGTQHGQGGRGAGRWGGGGV